MDDATQKPGGDKPASAVVGSSVVAPPPNPLLPRRCLHCGYNLLGTVDDGTCPECGGAYEPGAYMWTSTTQAQDRARAAPLIIASAVLAVHTVLFTMASLQSAMSAWMPAITLGILVIMAFVVYRQFNRDTPREYFVIMREGMRYRLAYDDQITKEEFKPWHEIDRVVPARYDRTATLVFKSALVDGERPIIEPFVTCPFFASAEEVLAFVDLVNERLHQHRAKPPANATKPPVNQA